MANQTLDNFLFFSNGYGAICAQDANHQIVIRGDRSGTQSDYTNYYQFGGTLAAGLGHKFWTGGTINSQTLKVQFADNGNYFACNVGIGTTSPVDKLEVRGVDNGITISSCASDRPVLSFCSGTASCLKLSSNTLYGAIGDGSNTDRYMVFRAGNVGIGISTPQSALHVAGTLAVNPTCTGVHVGVDSGGYAGIQLTGGTSQGGYIDFSCTGTDAPGRIIYYITSNSMDFTVCAASRMTIVCNGNIGVATANPSYRLHVNGTFYAAGSSIKYKEGICNYDTDSCLFMCLKPVTYQYKDEWQHLGRELKSQSQIGLIAEDVAEVMPELAVLVNEEDEKVVRNVDYEKLSVVLLKEVQKLRLEVDQLKNNK